MLDTLRKQKYATVAFLKLYITYFIGLKNTTNDEKIKTMTGYSWHEKSGFHTAHLLPSNKRRTLFTPVENIYQHSQHGIPLQITS